MYLKNYQIRVVSEIRRFLQVAKSSFDEFEAAKAHVTEKVRHTLNYVETVFDELHMPLNDDCRNGVGEHYPRVVLKVPTGGGKTILALEAIREYQAQFSQKPNGLIVWIVPSEAIYSQTVGRLRDRGHPYRQLLDQASGGNTVILEKGQRLSTQDIEENLVVLFVMIQSVSRATNKEALKVFQDSGGYESFFPPDNRYDLHRQLLEQVPNLDFISALGRQNPLIKTSMGNAIRLSNPFMIIDEIHKVFTPTAKATIDSLNPKMVLGLSATPREGMNIVSSVSGLELKEEEMVKLDMHIIPPTNTTQENWQAVVQEMKAQREELEDKSIEYMRNTGQYIRPIALIQVERTGRDQRGKGYVHSQDVKEYLVDLSINPDEVAIKTSTQNDIEDVDLFASDCPVRWIITKEALREGWDCSYAYMLGIIPNVNSNTGITQLVGRILRQPNAKKTGIRELDESYVYYAKGNTRLLLEGVAAGFRNEGLEDLITKLKVRDLDSVNTSMTSKIKRKYSKDYAGSLYLPVWVMVGGKEGERRLFSYPLDIRPYLNFKDYTLTAELIESIRSALSEESKERKVFAATLDDESKTAIRPDHIEPSVIDSINLGYMSRRFSEVIENSFLARKVAIQFLDLLNNELTEATVSKHFGFIVSALSKELQSERAKMEEAVFLNHLSANRLVLAVSDDERFGFKVPSTDTITVTTEPNTYKYYLFDEVEISSMNSLERKVSDALDKQETILWWFRNKASKDWYRIRGWRESHIYPDFVAAKKRKGGKIELVYIIESKGEHLANNPDTRYKKRILDLITEQNETGDIRAYQLEMPLRELNTDVEGYLVEEDKEEETIRSLMK